MKTIRDYPVQLITAGPDDITWIFTGEWELLDNFAATPVVVDIGRGLMKYPTSEHAYAAAKAAALTDHNNIRAFNDPGRAKLLGRRVDLRSDWDDVKFQTMWNILLAKFDQHPEVVRVLLATEERRIFEGNTWDDDIWGVLRLKPRGNLWQGRNALGQMLMEIRGLIRQGA